MIINIAASVALWVLCTSAPQSAKVKVSVNHSGSDSVGTTLALSVREAIRRSAGYELASETDALYEIKLISVDGNVPRPGTMSAIAIVITAANLIPYEKANPQTWLDIFLTASVVSLGNARVDGYGSVVLGILDAEVEKYKAASRAP